jgi:hypothetical protein
MMSWINEKFLLMWSWPGMCYEFEQLRQAKAEVLTRSRSAVRYMFGPVASAAAVSPDRLQDSPTGSSGRRFNFTISPSRLLSKDPSTSQQNGTKPGSNSVICLPWKDWQAQPPEPQRAAATRLGHLLLIVNDLVHHLGTVQCQRNQLYSQASLSPIQVFVQFDKQAHFDNFTSHTWEGRCIISLVIGCHMFLCLLLW